MERKEAIEIVKSEHFQNGLLLEALKTLIPELQNEDERIRKELIDLLNLLWRHYNFPYNRDKYEEFLAWLEKQGEHMSVEWNGEDKLNYEQAIYVCHQNGYTAVENWLKSLKPQNKWKPTEEQIMAFEHFVRSIGENGYASPYDNNTKLVSSLFNDLKKL